MVTDSDHLSHFAVKKRNKYNIPLNRIILYFTVYAVSHIHIFGDAPNYTLEPIPEHLLPH